MADMVVLKMITDDDNRNQFLIYRLRILNYFVRYLYFNFTVIIIELQTILGSQHLSE